MSCRDREEHSRAQPHRDKGNQRSREDTHLASQGREWVEEWPKDWSRKWGQEQVAFDPGEESAFHSKDNESPRSLMQGSKGMEFAF